MTTRHRAQMRQQAARKKLNELFGSKEVDRMLQEMREKERLTQAARKARRLARAEKAKAAKSAPQPRPNPVRAKVKSEVTMAQKRELAEQMIQNPTPAEARLWEMIQDSKAGAEFIRQVIIMGWIADFYCPAAKLVVEVDGGYHDTRKEQDETRDKVMYKGIGVLTLRFANEQVFEQPTYVFSKIQDRVATGLHNPQKRGWRSKPTRQ